MINKLKTLSKNDKATAAVIMALIAIIVGTFLVWFRVDGGNDQLIDRQLKVTHKSEYVLLSSPETTATDEAIAVMKNMTVTVDGETVVFDLVSLNGNVASFNSSLDVVLVIGNIDMASGIKNYKVTDAKTNKSVNGTMKVVFTNDLDGVTSESGEGTDGEGDSSSDGDFKRHIIEEDAHASVEREVDGVLNPVIDGYKAEVISGTMEGEAKIDENPYLHRDEDGTIDKESELPQQEVTVVEKPQPTPVATPTPTSTPTPISTPTATPQPTEITVVEGSTEPYPTESPVVEVQPTVEPTVEPTPEATAEVTPTPAAPSITTQYSKCVVVGTDGSATMTLWGDGSEKLVVNEADISIVDNGDGTVTTNYGVFKK